MKTLAIIGATGMLGQPVTRALVDAGFEVTALVRDVDKARTHLPPEVKLLAGDMRNPADLEILLTRKDFLYLNLSVKPTDGVHDWHPETDGLKTLLPIAKRLGIRRIGYLSSLVQQFQGTNGFRWWVFDVKNEAVALIKASGIPYSLFYPSTFMESFSQQIQGKRLLLAGQSRYPMHFIAGADYGRMVAQSFALTNDENREFVVQGTEAYTYDQAAAVFVNHYPKARLQIFKLPLGLLRVMGWFVAPFRYGANILYAINHYPETFASKATWEVLGRPITNLAQFARTYNNGK